MIIKLNQSEIELIEARLAKHRSNIRDQHAIKKEERNQREIDYSKAVVNTLNRWLKNG